MSDQTPPGRASPVKIIEWSLAALVLVGLGFGAAGVHGAAGVAAEARHHAARRLGAGGCGR